jgi:hypothetical protein
LQIPQCSFSASASECLLSITAVPYYAARWVSMLFLALPC